MSYYRELGLDKEPFSTSPDPGFFYHSLSHLTALKRLELTIRLKRGLSLIVGDIGIGKTTLWRALLRELDEAEFIFHVMLDPGFETGREFLENLVRIFDIEFKNGDPGELRSALERYLLRMGVEEGKTVIFIIDEGQKLSVENLEILRTLLNFETNDFKLIQLVILAQLELMPKIAQMRNFTDRIAMKYTLNPLDENETEEMIVFRLKQAGYRGRAPLFNEGAVKAVHAASRGFPRSIALLCHEAVKAAVAKDRDSVDETIIRQVIEGSAYERA